MVCLELIFVKLLGRLLVLSLGLAFCIVFMVVVCFSVGVGFVFILLPSVTILADSFFFSSFAYIQPYL